jgi:acyl-CoA synthetase (AMP-forming)/AMP-acid ligase II
VSRVNISTLIELLHIRAKDTPTRAAFHWEGMPCFFEDLWREVNRFGAHLHRQGIARGDRVVLALPNGPEFFFAFYGTQRVRRHGSAGFPWRRQDSRDRPAVRSPSRGFPFSQSGIPPQRDE